MPEKKNIEKKKTRDKHSKYDKVIYYNDDYKGHDLPALLEKGKTIHDQKTLTKVILDCVVDSTVFHQDLKQEHAELKIKYEALKTQFDKFNSVIKKRFELDDIIQSTVLNKELSKQEKEDLRIIVFNFWEDESWRISSLEEAFSKFVNYHPELYLRDVHITHFNKLVTGYMKKENK